MAYRTEVRHTNHGASPTVSGHTAPCYFDEYPTEDNVSLLINPSCGDSRGMLVRLILLRRKLVADDMARHGMLMAAFVAMAGLFDYLYQLSMSIMLTPEQYGTLFSLISLFMIVSVCSQGVQTSIAKFSSKFKAENKPARINYLWRVSLKRTIFIGLLLFIVLVLLSPLVSGFLKVDNNWYSIILFSCFILAFALPVNWGVLQGMQRFWSLGFSRVLWSFLKLSLGILLVYLGFAIYGALLPLLLTTIIVFLLTLFTLKSLTLAGNEKVELVGLSSYTGLALLAIACFAVLTNIDVILAKHYLSPENAGNYSAISVLGRIAFYAPYGVAIAMFPKISELFEKGAEHRSVLRKSMLLTLFIAGGVIMVYGLFPNFVVTGLFGGKYPFITPHLFRYGLAMLFFAVSFLLINYLLALNQTKVAYALLATTAFQVGLIVFFHSGIAQIVDIMLMTGILSTVIMLPFYLKVRKRPCTTMNG